MTTITPALPQVPEKPALEGLEQKWSARWEESGIHRFLPVGSVATSHGGDAPDPASGGPGAAAARVGVYSIDTPPPTASGSLHIGHVFSFTHTDLLARFHRMRGEHVFYPMGWDDNGLPTERRVQNYYGVRCDPSLPYDPDFQPPAEGTAKSTKAADQVPISRRNFIELCRRLTEEDEQRFEEVFRFLGLSVDWRQSYRTIGDEARAISQHAFLNNLARGEAYQALAPSLWDVSFRTAVAQAELEDREQPGAYHSIAFQGPSGNVVVESTRPELLAACVAVVTHPDDERYRDLVGRTVRSPVFGVEVPVVAHHLAQPDKGTGIAMVCTFGDLNDVVWWREFDLPTRTVIGFDGRFVAEAPDAITGDAGRAAYAELAGKTVFSARAAMVEQLRAAGALLADPRPITHPVKFYEKGDRPLEIVPTRQWYFVNGARDESLRERLLERGRELQFVPEFMRVRYENWVTGLTGDWLVSRQRFFGVPLPVWYRLDEQGEPDHDQVLVPDRAALPVDPSTDVPPGFTEADRGRPGGFVGEVDIMDTWATSSLTPEIAGGRYRGDGLWEAVFPYDLRPQGQDIIRTWLFSTLLRSELEHHRLPWRTAAISGFIVDPDRKKMSKSKGNVVTPAAILEQHGSDAVRYWAASSRLGSDAALDVANPTQMRKGRKLAIKVLNAAKFILGLEAGSLGPETVTEPLDLGMLATLDRVVGDATRAYEAADHARALEVVEPFFWTFCDDHLELVKDRAYGSGPGRDSAVAALRIALDTLLGLLAPVLPYATEEAWSWSHDGSLHTSPWPSPTALGGDPQVLAAAGEALIGIRRAKTDAKVSQRTPVASARITGPEQTVHRIGLVAGDVGAAGRIGSLSLDPGGETVEVADVVFQPTES
ncbi:MAG TPA: valine--tRNA ligase [Amnibacterium sp.]|nr:valine--tRNA ligase [Amnibacterium sp.]